MAGASYHVIARANRGELILEADEFKRLFLNVMASAQKKYRFCYHGFCLLDDCIHCIIKPAAHASISRIMQWILSVFAMRYNKRNAIKGHVWYDRFRSRILADIYQYLNAYIFVLKLPVILSLARNPSSYPFNNLNPSLAGFISDDQPP